jgi:hypothetical protein
MTIAMRQDTRREYGYITAFLSILLFSAKTVQAQCTPPPTRWQASVMHNGKGRKNPAVFFGEF